jgi:hypothetical protein
VLLALCVCVGGAWSLLASIEEEELGESDART